MKFLRTTSTRRLLALIAGIVIAVAGATAIAVAASSGGPVPRPKPLALAIHDALAAPQVKGISARITFTNHLIDSSNIQGSDPLLTGASGRLWLTTSGAERKLRLELQSDNGDAQAVLNGRSFWVYDPSSKTVYRGQLPNDTHKATRAKHESLPSVAQIESDLNKVMRHVDLSGAIPGDVAGEPVYTVRVSPKHDGGLLGAASLAWDAVRGVPLGLGVYARGSGSPVVELKVTDISYGPVSSSDFNVSPPSDAKVVTISTSTRAHAARVHAARLRANAHRHAVISGAAAVAKRLSFKLLAPRKLVGLPQQSVRLLDWGGTPAVLITYGQNLGGIAVLEQTASSANNTQAQSGDRHRRGLSLPTVSINGATGQELDTALGTAVRFTRGGVTYTVLGSVPPAAAEAAARQLT